VTFDKIKGIDLVVADMRLCLWCGAIVNSTAYEALSSEGVDVQQSDFYAAQNDLDATVREIEAGGGLLNHLFRFTDKRGVFLDFGAGKANVAIYATRHFRKSIACERDTRSLEKTLSHIGRPENLEIARDIRDTTEPADVLFMWHVLEHLAEPSKFWASQADRLAADATIFLQIPLYRPQYVVKSHYVFHTERSLTRWARSIGAAPIEFGYDIEYGFLSMVAQRVPGVVATS
jgi:hypothetical protein